MRDANAQLQASGALTATGTGTALDLLTGTPRSGLKASVLVTAVTGTSPTLALKIQGSSDNSTFVDLASCPSNNVTAVGEYYIPFETSLRYVRLAYTIGGTTPSFTLQADIVPARP